MNSIFVLTKICRSKPMRTSYNIYNSEEFIGFCVIIEKDHQRQASLVLFDSIVPEYYSEPNKIPGYTKDYPLTTLDKEIIRDMVSIPLPSIQTDSITYKAKKEGTTFRI